MISKKPLKTTKAAEIAQLGERQTEDLKVPGLILGFGNIWDAFNIRIPCWKYSFG